MANILFSILSTFNDKGLKKASKQVSLFEKQTKSLQTTFLKTFSALALINYSRKAVKAFAEDEKAAKSLELQLKNTGFAFSAPSVEYFIANLQKTTGVLDDELRPAFQQLLTVTGSITKSQEALGVALNISAATGKSLTEVSAALTRGFSGNTAGLSRLGAGISKATLKAGDMDAILAELNAKFTGQSAARLTTYAGKMDLIKVASADASEIIGKSLVDALASLGDDNSIEELTKSMENFATSIATVIRGLGQVASALKTVANTPGISQLLDVIKFTSVFGALSRAAGPAPAQGLPANQQRSAGRISAQMFRTEVKQQKELDRLRALEIAKLKAKTEVDKLKDKFDLERIGLNAALNAATDEETKLRLRSQLAILDNNEALAKKYLAEINSTTAVGALGLAAASAAVALLNISSSGVNIAGKMATIPNKYFEDFNPYASGNTASMPSTGNIANIPSTSGTTFVDNSQVIVNNAGSVLAEQDLIMTVQEVVLAIKRQGRGLTPAGLLDVGF